MQNSIYMNKILKNLKNKEAYLRRKLLQLKQWERVINILRSRAAKSNDKNKTELRHHIGKILVQKARTEHKLKQLQEAGDGKWDDCKIGFELSSGDLRDAILKASSRQNNN